MSSMCQYLLFLAIGIVLTFPFYTVAQNPQFQSVSNEIKLKFEKRQKQIIQELSNLRDDEWAGGYWAQESSIDGSLFYWAPTNGFTVRRGNDFHRGIEQVNYGSVNFNGKILTVSPEYNEKSKHSYPISTSFIPIRWGQQHWLIPSDKLILFLYAVNSGDYDEIYSFFLKENDEKKLNEGLPDVPKEYRKYLKIKPIKAKVSKVKINNSAYFDYEFELNVGKFDGVIEGMKFYLVGVKNVHVWIKVVDVRKHTSTAQVISIGRSGGYENEIKPKIGWIFSSRFPEGY